MLESLIEIILLMYVVFFVICTLSINNAFKAKHMKPTFSIKTMRIILLISYSLCAVFSMILLWKHLKSLF